MKAVGTKQLNKSDMEYLREIKDPLMIKLMMFKVRIQHGYEYTAGEPVRLFDWLRESIKSVYFVEERTDNYSTNVRFSDEADSLMCVMRWNEENERDDDD